MGFRAEYWSCSKAADWIRRTFGAVPKPESATSTEWNQWRKAQKKEHPIVWWVTEEALDKIQDAINWIPDTIDSVRFYFVNRYLDKLHYVPTRLKAGQWHETDTRLLHGMFELLVDFVEIQKAWMNVVWDKDNWKKYDFPKWYRFRFLRWAAHRRVPRAGLDYLAWEMSLAEPNVDEHGIDHSCARQAEAAKEILALYTWWKTIRPNRPDPMEVSGWSAYCDRRREQDDDILSFLDDRSDEDRAESAEILGRCNALEEQYDKEDEEMMVRLIKIRHSLWT